MENTDFTVYGKIWRIESEHKQHLSIELEDAHIDIANEKDVIKTFSDATLLEEISRRWDVDLVINQIK